MEQPWRGQRSEEKISKNVDFSLSKNVDFSLWGNRATTWIHIMEKKVRPKSRKSHIVLRPKEGIGSPLKNWSDCSRWNEPWCRKALTFKDAANHFSSTKLRPHELLLLLLLLIGKKSMYYGHTGHSGRIAARKQMKLKYRRWLQFNLGVCPIM